MWNDNGSAFREIPGNVEACESCERMARKSEMCFLKVGQNIQLTFQIRLFPAPSFSSSVHFPVFCTAARGKNFEKKHMSLADRFHAEGY